MITKTVAVLMVLVVIRCQPVQAHDEDIPLCYELAVAQAELMITEFGEPNNEFIEDLANDFYNNPLIQCR